MILIGLAILLYIISMIIWWTRFKTLFTSAMWWLVVLPPIAYILWVFTFLCITKGDEDKKTLRRQLAVYNTLNQINRTNLKGSDVQMRMGSYSAWLETRYDPKKRKQ
jgi:hypothetical protein